jgi:hypothetical protein
MTVTFTLNSTYLGTEAGPFNISGTTDSNVTTELITNLSLSDLTTGHTISGIDDNTTGFTIQSAGTCINYVVKPVSGTVPYVPCTDGMDVVFLVDYTGSMGGAIDGVKTSIANIASTIVTESNSNYRLGLVIFDEYSSATNSTYDDKTAYTSLPSNQRYINTGIGGKYQWITAVEMMSTNNETSFTTQLNKLNTVNFPLGSGENTPEPSDIGVDLVGLQNFANSFRTGVARLVVLITDATPGGNDDAYGAADISFVNSLIPQLVNKGVRVLLMTTAGTNVLYDLATGTNGVVSSGFTGSNIITAIEEVCVPQYQYTVLINENPSLEQTCNNDGSGTIGSLISTSNALTIGDTLFYAGDPGTAYKNANEGYSVKITNTTTGIVYAVETNLSTGEIIDIQECTGPSATPTPTATTSFGNEFVAFGSNRTIACDELTNPNTQVFFTAANWNSIQLGDVLYNSDLVTAKPNGYYYNASADSGMEVVRMLGGEVIGISDCAGGIV